EEFGLVGIEIFRQRIRRHGAATEGYDLFPDRQDGEHDAITEPVIGHRDVRPVYDKSASLDGFLRNTLAGEKFLERIAAVRRVAEAESLDGAPGQPAIAQIGARLRSDRRLQLILEEARRQFHDLDE